MGEVYRARDTKLGRDVAIKVLPEAFLFDPDRVARFEREARVLASLNHPNIAALYGMEESGGRHFLVMELVEGETIAERLRRGPIAPEHALRFAHQMADALEAAHEKGVVHRDLKPANVKITPDENVKVLDFGLAKAFDPVGRGPADALATNSPTLSMMATEAGMILGTAAYMSPEQANGRQADHRSDVFSFGAVLYEMLTARQPFQGETVPEILASVLVREPDFSALPPNLNPRLLELLRRCLEKNPKRRWQAVGDLRAEIEAIAAAPRAVTPASQVIALQQPLWKRAVPVVAGVALASALTSALWWSFRPSTPPPIVTRFTLTLPEGQAFTGNTRHVLAISKDASKLVYVANNRLYLRLMSDLDARPIAGIETKNPVDPVFSPDGQSLAFFSGTALERIPVSGGTGVQICPVDTLYGMTWDNSGILFGSSKGVIQVAATGGAPRTVVAVKSGEFASSPQLLPDGRTVLFTLTSREASAQTVDAKIVVRSLQSDEQKVLIDAGSDARYLSTGHIVYAVGGVLFAVPFNPQRLEVTGGPVPVVEGVRPVSAAAFGGAIGQFALSDNGLLAYIPGAPSARGGLTSLDDSGKVEPLKLPPGSYEAPHISPDGKHLAFGTDDGRQQADIWVYDLGGASASRRLTFGGKNRLPIWSADGDRIAFQSDREGDLGMFWQRADGSGSAERLTKPEQGTSQIPESWSPKGDTFSFSQIITGSGAATLWTFSLREKKATRFGNLQNRAPFNSAFSPDGRWIAYTRRPQEEQLPSVYVELFPPTGGRYEVGTRGSHHPLWSPDEKRLFFFPAGGSVLLAAASVVTQPTFTFGDPTPIPGAFATNTAAEGPRNHDIAPDGKHLILVDQGAQFTSVFNEIRFVQNWFEELKQRVPVAK